MANKSIRWIVPEYKLGPYYTLEAARAEATAYERRMILPATRKNTNIVQVRERTTADLPEMVPNVVLTDVLEALADWCPAGFERLNPVLVPGDQQDKLARTLRDVFAAGVEVDSEAAWITTGVVEALHK